jgi:hypothetical protein
MKLNLTVGRVIDELRRTGGMRSLTAKNLGCSRANVTQWINNYPEIRAALAEIEGSAVDLAHANVVNAMKGEHEGRRLSASMYYLSRKGGELGFGSTVEVKSPKQINAIPGVDFTELSTDELRAIGDAYEATLSEGRAVRGRQASLPSPAGGEAPPLHQESVSDSGPGSLRGRKAHRGNKRKTGRSGGRADNKAADKRPT